MIPDNEATAKSAAEALADTLTEVLTPTELRLFLNEAYRISLALIQACRQQAVRDFIRYEPSAN